MNKFWENLGFVVLTLLIIAQCVVGGNYLGGQLLYLAANILAITRSFKLHRGAGDKVKDVTCGALTMGLIGLYLLR